MVGSNNNSTLELQLPAVLYTPHRDERWCKTADAVWWDLTESKKLRERTIADMIEEAATFDRALVVLRPLMEGHRDMTVGEALDRLNSA